MDHIPLDELHLVLRVKSCPNRQFDLRGCGKGQALWLFQSIKRGDTNRADYSHPGMWLFMSCMGERRRRWARNGWIWLDQSQWLWQENLLRRLPNNFQRILHSDTAAAVIKIWKVRPRGYLSNTQDLLSCPKLHDISHNLKYGVKKKKNTVQQKIFVSEKFRQKRPSGSSSGIYFRQTSGRSFCLRSFGSLAYRLSSHSWLFLIPHLSFWEIKKKKKFVRNLI